MQDLREELYKVETYTKSLVMIASLETIANVLELHPDGAARMKRETSQGKTCELSSNGRRRWNTVYVSYLGETWQVLGEPMP